MIPITFAAAGDGFALLVIGLVLWGLVSVVMCAFAPPEKQVGVFLLTFLLGPLGLIISIIYLTLIYEPPPPQPVAKPVNKNDYDQELKHKLREFYDEQRYYYGASEDTLQWLKSELPVVRSEVMRALYKESAAAADRVLTESLSKLRAESAEKEKAHA